jgi:hypothetical protein
VQSDSRTGLTPAKFYAITRPLMFGLSAEQEAKARLRVFLGLPPRLQKSFHDSLQIGSGTRPLRAMAGGEPPSPPAVPESREVAP